MLYVDRCVVEESKMYVFVIVLICSKWVLVLGFLDEIEDRMTYTTKMESIYQMQNNRSSNRPSEMEIG